MIIGIDATNIGGGGGITHLKGILDHYDQISFSDKISRIVVFSSQKVLDEIEDRSIIEKVTFPALNKGILSRIFFQMKDYDKEIRKRCDVLFSITGDYIGKFKPVIGMSRNMLLYERDIWLEIKQPKEVLRFWLNFRKQKKCFKNASGIIFISKYAQNYVGTKLNIALTNKKVIHHGISTRFKGEVKEQKNIESYSQIQPFKFLYVSTVHVYKHHWNVVRAIAQLRNEGFPVTLDLVGGVIFKPAGDRLMQAIEEVDPKGKFIHFLGHQNYEQIDQKYKNADGIIFASTCENMPNILLESMASGVPIASSQKQPMPEFLNNSGFYFNATSVPSIFEALKSFLSQPKERGEKAVENLKAIEKYSWEKTSFETFQFITEVYAQ